MKKMFTCLKFNLQGKKIHPIYKICYLESVSYLIGFKDNQKEKQTNKKQQHQFKMVNSPLVFNVS